MKLRTHISISHLDLGALEIGIYSSLHYSLMGLAFIIQNNLRLINNVIFLVNLFNSTGVVNPPLL